MKEKNPNGKNDVGSVPKNTINHSSIFARCEHKRSGTSDGVLDLFFFLSHICENPSTKMNECQNTAHPSKLQSKLEIFEMTDPH